MKSTHEQQLWGIVLAAGEGTRVREFLTKLCGGRGIKQFCAVTGRRSMLQHTLDRAERLIPRERVLVVVSAEHRPEVESQLASWPVDNIIYQPRNRDTAPGILLPLAYVSHRDSQAHVAIFPSDHFIQDEARFLRAVSRAVTEVDRFPQDFVLLGMSPDEAEEGYGWIEPAATEEGRGTHAVQRFWEKPDPVTTHALLSRGALWNTFVCVASAPTSSSRFLPFKSRRRRKASPRLTQTVVVFGGTASRGSLLWPRKTSGYRFLFVCRKKWIVSSMS